MPRIYALLVGINDYVAVGKLAGCVADIDAVDALLRKRVAADALDVLTLRDAGATRVAIIDGFRTHLTQATKDDVAVFYYCGHGSQEAVPPEWAALAPTGTNQTIVPVDARTGDVFDIADKELSALIHEVATSGAQVVTLFDSCHSGGVTRDVDDDGVSRTADASGRSRTMADYLDLARALYDPARFTSDAPPEPRHIAIAACQYDETAKEFPTVAPRRGAFTRAFEEAVNTLGPSATYIDLLTAIRTTVRGRAKNQIPNLSISGGASGSAVFLGGHAGRRDLTVNADAGGTWWLSAGAVDGIASPDDGRVTEVSLFERTTFARDGVAATPLARAAVDLTEADRARLKLTAGDAALDVSQVYAGVVTKLSVVPMHVIVAGADAAGTARVRAFLAGRAVNYAVAVTPVSGVPHVTASVAGDSITVLDAQGVAFENLRFGLGDNDLAALDVACVQMARWHDTRDRRPVGSSLNDVVLVDLVPAVKQETGIPADRAAHAVVNGMVTLRYDSAGPPYMQLRIRNTSSQRLYVALLSLSDTFECAVAFSDWLPAGATVYVRGGRPQKLEIPAWRRSSFTVATEFVKVIAAQLEFSVTQFAMPPLLAPAAGGERAFTEDSDDRSFWGTTMFRVEIHR